MQKGTIEVILLNAVNLNVMFVKALSLPGFIHLCEGLNIVS